MRKTITKALVWKELSEARWALYAGLVIFLAMPVLAISVNFLNGRDSLWIEMRGNGDSAMFGGIFKMLMFAGFFFALLLAVSLNRSDQSDEDKPELWQLLPISANRIASTKLIVGLAILLTVWLVVGAVDAIICIALQDARQGTVIQWSAWAGYLVWYVQSIGGAAIFLFMNMVLFVITFAITALTRRALPAIFLSVTLGLLIVFVPLLIPSLESMSLWYFTGGRLLHVYSVKQFASFINAGEQVRSTLKLFGYHVFFARNIAPYLIYVSILFATGLLGSFLIFTRRWHIRITAQSLAWFFCVVGLSLYSLAAVQIGNNLSPIQIVDLPEDMYIQDVKLYGQQGFALTKKTNQENIRDRHWQLHQLDLSQSKILSSSFLDCDVLTPWNPDKIVGWSPDHPQLAYRVQTDINFNKQQKHWELRDAKLQTITFDAMGNPIVRHQIDWYGEQLLDNYLRGTNPRIYVSGNTLWLYMTIVKDRLSELLVKRYDIHNPVEPQYIGQYAMPLFYNSISCTRAKDGKPMAQLHMPVIDGISENEMWQLRQNIGYYASAKPFVINPKCMIAKTNSRDIQFNIFKCLPSETTSSPGHKRYWFQQDYTYRMSAIHRILPPQIDQWLYQDGMLFMLIRRPQYGMMVLDVRDPEDIKQVGYYYAPGEKLHRICGLADGRVALIGKKMHIFDPKTW